MNDHRPVLEARRLTKRFRGARTGLLPKRRDLVAVDDVSITLAESRVTALVGESGSGKSVLSKMLARIVKPSSGELLLDGEAVPTTSKHRLEYARHVQLVLQDPFSAMNPVHTVHYHLERALRIHGTARADVEDGIRQLLERVALSPADRFASAFPHELSGGQLQRVSVARALAAQPRVLLADEPVSMLDVSVRLGLLNLLADLRDTDGLAILYITHDIASARYLADEIVVMYLGQVVEVAPAKELTASPDHPYTKLLIASSPDPDRLGRTPRKIAVRGARPDAPESGCKFRRRCPYAEAICATDVPPLFPAGDQSAGTHLSRCWLADPGRTLESERNPPSALVGPARDHLTTSEEKEVAAPTAPLNPPENGGRARPADNVEHSQK